MSIRCSPSTRSSRSTPATSCSAASTSGGAGGELALTLEALQPKLEAKLRNETRDSVTGKTMVFAIVPLPRNLRTQ